ncbi:hypothetical protein D9C73_024573 [Collichthys lucidus]|uniref:Uncharacterized protein n=1 Tax=Collichthys lucidus TaxID=240159 RepID=A0A4U5VQK3_COLLU|nr:hypothetical protein D9C73_024573 [Collichthys lucidus]
MYNLFPLKHNRRSSACFHNNQSPSVCTRTRAEPQSSILKFVREKVRRVRHQASTDVNEDSRDVKVKVQFCDPNTSSKRF